MSQAAPGYWLSYQVPPKLSDFSRMVKRTPISFSLMAQSRPEKPAPMIMAWKFSAPFYWKWFVIHLIVQVLFAYLRFSLSVKVDKSDKQCKLSCSMKPGPSQVSGCGRGKKSRKGQARDEMHALMATLPFCISGTRGSQSKECVKYESSVWTFLLVSQIKIRLDLFVQFQDYFNLLPFITLRCQGNCCFSIP